MKEILPLLAGLGVTFFTQDGIWGLFAWYVVLVLVFWSDNPAEGFWTAVGISILATLLSAVVFVVSLAIMFVIGMFKEDWHTDLAAGHFTEWCYYIALFLVFGTLRVFRKAMAD